MTERAVAWPGEHEEHHSSEGEGESGLAPLPAPTSAVIIVGNR